MEKIGTRVILGQFRFLIPDGETAEFTVDHLGANIKITLEYHFKAAEDNKSRIAWEGRENTFHFKVESRDALGAIASGSLGTFKNGAEFEFFTSFTSHNNIGDLFFQFTTKGGPNV